MLSTRAALFAIPTLFVLTGCPVWIESDLDPMPCAGIGCACDRDSDCSGDNECSGGICVAPEPPPPDCVRDSDCDGENMICEGGVCIDDTPPPPPPPPPETCRTHGDCVAGSYCNDGICTESSTCTSDTACMDDWICDFRDTCVPEANNACRTTADCVNTGDVCVEGFCRDPMDNCQFNYECGEGRVCFNGGCTEVCGSDPSVCGSGSTCDRGFCRPISECSSSSECETREHCVDGRCLQDCTGESACINAADYCSPDDLFCRPDWRRRPFCTEATVARDCAPGSVCVDGACRTPCPTGMNSQCMMTDALLPICADDMLCYATNETAPECATETDCPDMDDRCIDAICR